MRRADEFGRFLRSRRARVEPEIVGLAPGARRRVEGLRREELAQLANISVDYLIRLEQGRIERPSPEVVEALARSLLLDSSERRHLFRLAAASEPTAGHGDGTSVRAGIRLLIDSLDHLPAVLLSRRLDLLHWNPTARRSSARSPRTATTRAWSFKSRRSARFTPPGMRPHGKRRPCCGTPWRATPTTPGSKHSSSSSTLPTRSSPYGGTPTT